jgi:S-adenosylmethionine:tRNA ribosyltransferase-isomerase
LFADFAIEHPRAPMRLSELDYELPSELIAQEPLQRREEARLLAVDRRARAFEHSRFYKLSRHLREGDLLILNDTRVLPARLFARKESGGKVELLMVRALGEHGGAWLALMRSHRALKEGARLIAENGRVLRIVGCQKPGRPIIASGDSVTIEEILAESGTLALPHYIRRPLRNGDWADYQTVFASHPGAVAAPTAGLHFSDALLAELEAAGIRRAFLTLHVGPGTFAPLRSAEVEAHTMEAEWYVIPEETVRAIEQASRTGGRVIAVGTSGARALESFAITRDVEGFTGLFISPGFRFKLVDAMITNFHMPRSTVLALVMAFAGRDLILDAYREAIRRRYRFLSYGDAMLII